MTKRAQGSAEWAVLVVVGLTVIIGLIVFSQESLDASNDRIENERAAIAAEEIIEAAELVHSQGEGSTTQRYLIIPDNVHEIKVTGRTISIVLDNGNTVSRNADFNLTGNLSGVEGNRYITVKSMSNSIVSISA